MITVNPAKSKRISGPAAVAMVRKNLKSAAWFALFGLVTCAGHTYGLRGGWQYALLACAIVSASIHSWVAIYYFRQLKALKRGDEVVITMLPRSLAYTPWMLDLVVVAVLSIFVLPFIGLPWHFILGPYVWWAKMLAFLFSAGATWLLTRAWKKAFTGRRDQIRFNNALWRLKAITTVPHLQKYIAQESSVPGLWITLSYFFEQGYEPEYRNDRLIRDIYAFAEWSLLSSGGELPEDEAKDLKDGAVLFYESAIQSPLAGPDSINHITQSVRAELSREAITR